MSLSILSDQQLEEVVRTLPAAPRILAQLAPRLQLLDTDVSDVTAILRRDAGLTARLIDMANSAAFIGLDPATSIEEAVARVGFRETYRIIGAVASTQLSDEALPYYGISPRRMRENALFCALVMEELADHATIDGGTAYTIGLLRSIGKVVLDRLVRHRLGVAPFDARRDSVLEWERSIWGLSNPQVAARVLEIWEFPREAIEAVRHHLDPGESNRPEARLLNLAAAAADVHGIGLPGESRHLAYGADAFAWAGVSESHAVWAADRANSILQRVSVALV